MTTWLLLLRGVLRTRRHLLPVAAALAALLVTAALARLGQGNDAIAGLPAELLLPLAAAAAARATTAFASGDSRLALDALVARRLSPARALGAHWLVTYTLTAFVLLVGGSLFALVSHRSDDAPLAGELLGTLPVLAASAAAYTSYYVGLGTFGRGRGLVVGILADLVLGSAQGVGWIVPQAHLASLLGRRPSSLSAHGHFLWLYALALGFAALAYVRARAPRAYEPPPSRA